MIVLKGQVTPVRDYLFLEEVKEEKSRLHVPEGLVLPDKMHETVARVVARGPEVKHFEVGDQVMVGKELLTKDDSTSFVMYCGGDGGEHPELFMLVREGEIPCKLRPVESMS